MLEHLKIGVLGGGQFRKKLLHYALRSGLNIALMDKDVNTTSAINKSFFKNGDPTKFDDVFKFGENLDILTVDYDTVNILALKQLRDLGIRIHPSPEIIELIQNKYLQKQFLKDNNIPTVTNWIVSNLVDSELISDNAIAQKERNAGAHKLNSQIYAQTWENLSNEIEVPYILEKTLIVKREVHVTISRNENGTIECYSPALMILDRGKMFVDLVLCPVELDSDIAIAACRLAAKVVNSMKLTGIITVELVIANNGKAYVNDLATKSYKCPSHKRQSSCINKSAMLRSMLLELPIDDAETNKYCSKSTIIEPAAHRKRIIEQAVNTLLGNCDINAYPSGDKLNVRKAHPITINEQVMEEKLSKAIMIMHILQTDENGEDLA